MLHGRELVDVGLQHRVDRLGPEAEDHREDGEHERRGEERGLHPLHVADHGPAADPGVELGELGGLVGEPAPHEPGAVGEGQHGADHEPGEHHGPRRALDVVGEGGQHGLLGHEAGQRGQPGHGRRGHERDGEQDGHAAGEPRQAADVPGARPVVDDPDHEEQRGLEQPVREEHGHARLRRVRGAAAHDDHEEAELADGAVGEDQLQVVLLQGRPAAEEHGAQPQHRDGRLPQRRLGEARGEAGHQVDAGLDHRGGVQVRGHRGGRGHRGRQPEVQRDQRGLRHGADEEQEDRHVHHGPALRQLGGRREHLGDPVGARGLAQHHDADQHGQAAGGGEHEGLQRRAPGGQAGPAVADEQERQDGGDLPEDEQHQHVVGGHQAEHGAREGEQLRAEAADAARAGLEVAGAVEQHQGAHAEHEQGHRPREGVHAQHQVQAQGRDPLPALGPAALRAVDPRAGAQQPQEAGERDRRQEVEGAASHPCEQQGRDRGHHCVEQEHSGHQAPPGVGEEIGGRASRGPDAGTDDLCEHGVAGAHPGVPPYQRGVAAPARMS